ncbi:MAG: 5'-nucleotidase C-terminal domain-containing protein [Bacteroidia bacterium]|nr:5'-nucleotidase C-terminal domain-containing protein [Bacteroidia bacterium]
MIRSLFVSIVALLLSVNVQMFAQQAKHLTVLHLNDSHSNLLPGAPRDMLGQGTMGGIARVATVINRERLGDQPVLTLHAGDVFIGDPMYNLFYDQPLELSLLAALGIDAMAVGNHEFDLTPYYLEQALNNTLGAPPAFPLLSANLDLTNWSSLSQYIQPAVIKQYPGMKVGIFGLTTPAANYLSQPYPVVVIGDPANPTPLMQLIAAQVTDLRDSGCDIVICLSHMGVALDQAIAANIPGIDVIVGGHDHWPLAQPLVVQNPSGKPVSIVQTVGHNRQIGKLHLKLHKGVVTVLNYHLINLDSTVPEDATIKGMVDGAASLLEGYLPGLFSQPVALCTGTLTQEAVGVDQPGYHDTHAGNLITDAYMAATGADIAVQAGGSIAQPLYAGPVLPVDIFRMIGYGFNTTNGLGYFVTTIDVKGSDLWMALESVLADLSSDEMLMQVSSSMSYAYDPTKAVGSRLQYVLINGSMIDPNTTYTVACNEAVPMFLTLMGVPFSNPQPTMYTEFEVMLDYIMTLGTVSPGTLPGRVRAIVVPKRAEDIQPVALSVTTSPNPFTDNAVINVTLSDASELTLLVVDVLGRTVARLAEGRYDAGMVSKQLHAGALQAGVYFVVAQTGDGHVLTSRILKMR